MDENLTNLCRVCFGQGEYNLWEYRVQLPPEADQDLLNDASSEVCVQEMLSAFRKEEVDELHGGFACTVQLICDICLNELVPSFLFCRKVERADKKLASFLSDLKNKANVEEDRENKAQQTEEYLEELQSGKEGKLSIVEPESIISEPLEPEEHFRHEIDNSCNEQPIAQVPKALKRRKPVKNPTFVLTGGVSQILAHASRLNSPPMLQNLRSPIRTCSPSCSLTSDTHTQQKRSKITEREKTKLDAGSFVVTQFIPSTAQIRMESLYGNGDGHHLHGNPPPDNPMAGNELRTMDYAAVEIDASTSEVQVNESDTPTYPNASTHAQSQAVYLCKYCPQAFSAVNFLITHVRKRHVCKFCTRGFSETSQLFEHIRSAHNEHKCAICSKELSTHSNLRNHIKRVHGVKLPAQVALLDYRRRAKVVKQATEDMAENVIDLQSPDEHEVKDECVEVHHDQAEFVALVEHDGLSEYVTDQFVAAHTTYEERLAPSN